MFKRSNRLHLRRDISSVRRLGNVKRGKLFSVWFLENGKDAPRIGIVVSKKISGKAVERNKLTRWMRASLSSQIPEMAPFDVLVVAFRPFPHYSHEETERELLSLLKSAELLKK